MRDHPDVFVIGDGRVELHDRLQTPHDRTEAVEGVLVSWRDQKKFPSLKGWRSERYSVWGNGSSAAGGSRTQVVMEVERAAAGLFGMRGYGCHVNGYVTDSGTGQLRMWIAKRSLTKQTYPGMLDNLVGGGLAHGYDPRSNIVKECFEEAGITDVSKLKAVSVINFFGYSTDRGLLPDTEYLYDIELPEGWEPVCQDGEVAGFSLLTIEEVKQHLAAGEFMPESGLCVVDFLLRHGFVDASSEPDYVDISVGLRRPLPFPGPTYGV
ncbi:NUDIX hydrolase domain-like protein [Zopfochytrium polystomum]|nr:NUDIX hydrolase domain-like protein [Zopfochytrium polystomum]